MSDSIITTYGIGGYQVFLDAETVTTTAAQKSSVRPRIQISARDITTGTPTEIGDAANQAIRVNLVAGSISVSANPNVTVTNWTAAQVVSVSLSQVVLSSNVAPTTPTGPAVQVARSLVELLVPIYQVVSTTAASATIIPAVSGKRIFVTGYHLVVTPAAVVNWEDSAATPNGLTGPMSFAAQSGVSAYGTIDTPVFAVVTPGNALRIRQSTTASLAGVVTAIQF